MASKQPRPKPTMKSRFFSSTGPLLEKFRTICVQHIDREEYPLCSEVKSNVPIYDARILDLSNGSLVEQLADEFHHILLKGSGVFVLKGMYEDAELLQKVNQTFWEIIAGEKGLNKGDHFGHSNERIWNSFEKHGRRDPATFYQYYSNPWLSMISEAWLGPAYRVTAQVNVVKPAGQAQSPHRDYHLGFLDAATCARYPAATQISTQFLTLQGAVAHSEMPLESGPTRLLPFSQQFEEGYVAYRRPEFAEFFTENYVSVPLQLGDGLFFNPALFHAAGQNTSASIERIANLLQISSAFGKPMELVQTIPLIESTWSTLRDEYQTHGLTTAIRTFIATVAEGYPFPLSLDRQPPRPSGMAPESEQEVVALALKECWSASDLRCRLEKLRQP